MSRHQYPKLGDSRDITTQQRRRPVVHKKRCVMCGQEAAREVWIQVDWFRGNDEGLAHACMAHRNDAGLIDAFYQQLGPEQRDGDQHD